MPASPRRWWWSASWRRPATSAGARWGARPSSPRSGSGRSSRAAPSWSSASGSGIRSTCRATASPWTRASTTRFCGRSSSSTDKGLIFRGKRLVNWDPHFETAISDLEVEQVETRGHLWRLRYPLEDGATYEHPVAWDDEGRPTGFETRDYLVVATTRPETMLGDTGVAVHPEDDALPPPRRQDRAAAAGRAVDPDRRRRLRRPGEGHRRGQDHPGARLQRLGGRAAARARRRST